MAGPRVSRQTSERSASARRRPDWIRIAVVLAVFLLFAVGLFMSVAVAAPSSILDRSRGHPIDESTSWHGKPVASAERPGESYRRSFRRLTFAARLEAYLDRKDSRHEQKSMAAGLGMIRDRAPEGRV